MDFDEWWNSDHERENMYVSTHARAAWDYQQQRIAELEAELKREKTALENWINDALKLEAENQRLREAVRTVYGDSGLAEVESKAALLREGE